MRLETVYFHAQPAVIYFFFAKYMPCVAGRDCASASVDQIVITNPGAISLHQPTLDLRKPSSDQNLHPLISAATRLLPLEVRLFVKLPKDQFRVRFANSLLTICRYEVIDFL